MRTLSEDTSLEAERVMVDGYRRMSAARKAAQVSALTLGVQRIALSGIQQRHPHAPERERRLRLASLWLDRSIMVNVFRWDPKIEGY